MIRKLGLFFLAFFAFSTVQLAALAVETAKTAGEESVKEAALREIRAEQVQEPPLTDISAVPMKATYYAKRFNGRKTASGERFNSSALTCAHRTLPFNTLLKVTNPDNGNSVVVRVNDRGPFTRGIDLDISYAAAKEIGLIKHGVKKYQVTILGIANEEVARN